MKIFIFYFFVQISILEIEAFESHFLMILGEIHILNLLKEQSEIL